MESTQMKLSIIVPIYKVEAYLARCVDSLLAQDIGPMEILLIDDGSPDSCGEICDAYASRDARVRAYHKPNGGLSDARNYGLDRASGEYLLFVDSDDYLVPHICETLVPEAESLSADVVIGPMLLEKPSKSMERYERIAAERFESHRVYTGPEYLEGCLEGGALRVEVVRSLYRRQFLLDNGFRFRKGILHEDEEFTPQVLLQAKNVMLYDRAFYHYDNAREGSIMNSPSLKNVTDRVDIYNSQRKLYRTVKPQRLRRLLEDDLSWKYLACYCSSPAEHRHSLAFGRFTPLCCAWHLKRRIKALAFALSPELYVRRVSK